MFKSVKKQSVSYRKRAILPSFLIAGILFCSSILSMPDSSFAITANELEEYNQRASEASQQYDDALAIQASLQEQINQVEAQLADMETNQLPFAQAQYNEVIKDMYRNDTSKLNFILQLLDENNFNQMLSNYYAYEKIAEYKLEVIENLTKVKEDIQQSKIDLLVKKEEQDILVEELSIKKQEALDAQEAARQAYNNAQVSTITTTRRAPTSSSFYDEASAKGFIVMKESGGNYNARNGRYIGAYQLTDSYLGGDYSPENQDRVAEQYVMGRYGSWVNAANFWVSHGWY